MNNNTVSLIPKVLELLNLLPEEEFRYFNSEDNMWIDSVFFVNKYGAIFERKSNLDYFLPSSCLEMRQLLAHPYNIVKVKYRPKFNEEYYTIQVSPDLYVYKTVWANSSLDIFMYNTGLTFKTEAMAIAKLNILTGNMTKVKKEE